MRLDRSVGLTLLFAILGPGWASSKGADSIAESVLKGKGLTKTVHTYVIEDEKPVLEKMKELRGVFASYATAVEKQVAVEQMAMQSAELEQNHLGLQANLNALNQQIAQQQSSSMNRRGANRYPTPLIAERDQIRATLAEVNQTQQALKSQALQPKDKTALADEIKKKEEAFKTALADLRKQVDEVTKKYADLGADESVKKAIDALQTASKAKVNLGPSDAFLAGVKNLDQAERQFLGKKSPTASSKKKTTKAKK